MIMEMNQLGKNTKRSLVMAAVFIATFMTSVEVTIVTTALPSIISDLEGLSMQSWIMSSYLLTTAVTTPIYGKLADTIGRKHVFQFGVLLFTLGTWLSGLAPNIMLLIFARGLQGIGAGAVMPLTFTIIADYFDFEERAKILALNNTAWGLSALMGPLLGGFLVDNLSWHWVFFVNVPLGLFVFLLMAVGDHQPQPEKQKMRFDWRGIFWLAATLVTLLLGIQNSQHISGWLLLAAALLCLYLLIRQEKHAKEPLIPLKMFQNPTFSVQILTATLLSGVLIGYQVYFPIWLQSLYRLPATQAGLAVTSSSIMWLLASFLVGPLLKRLPPRRITLILVLLLTCAYSPLIFAAGGFPTWVFYLIAMTNGTVMGIVITMNTMLTQHLVDPQYVGSATSIFTLGRSLGQTIMTGFFGTLFTFLIRQNLHGASFKKINEIISSAHPAAASSELSRPILAGLHGVFIIVVLLLAVVLWCNWRDPHRGMIE